MEYTVVYHSDVDVLSQLVTEKLGEGWKLYGTMQVEINQIEPSGWTDLLFYQPMIKEPLVIGAV